MSLDLFAARGVPPRLVLIAVLSLSALSLSAPSLAELNAGAAESATFNPAVDNAAVDVVDGSNAESASQPGERLELDLVSGTIEQRVERVLAVMTLDEKIGQLCQIAVFGEGLEPAVVDDLRAGRLGSLFYTGSAAQTREAQRIAREESRLGLPLLTPRDVIHGFRMVFPIPIGQAASWNPDLVRQASRVAAAEAIEQGVNWTFAPMMDVTRDARWGRIAESFGEDPRLASAMATAMVEGFQGDDAEHGIAACAKHYVAYGLSEGGRDYNRAQVSISELNNVFLQPFDAAVEAGCATVMTGFSSVNGVPATGHAGLIRGRLKASRGFDGLVVSDWSSILEMVEHGFAEDRADAARLAINAGLDMEMATTTYRNNLARLVQSGAVTESTLDDSVRRVLRTKFRYAMTDASTPRPTLADGEASTTARDLARQSVVLLKNDDALLPLRADKPTRVALVGPLADAARDQLGCWMLDGRPEDSVTLRQALVELGSESVTLDWVPALESSIDEDPAGIAAAVAAAEDADVAIVCVGEGWQLSGEARCRVGLGLPGQQSALVQAVAETGTPTVLVVLAGRPLTIGPQIDACGAVLYAWHPGTMAGPAIADLLTGKACPSGKLPVTFPKHVGQTPLYYNAPNTGRPPLAGTRALLGSGLNDFPEDQKYRSHYLDVDPFPLFPFGFGLSYTQFEYGTVELSQVAIDAGQTLGVRTLLTNTGPVEAEEVVQLYVQDRFASLVRPMRELKDFRRVRLKPGDSVVVEFALPADALAFIDNDAQRRLEPGEFRVAVGGDSTAPLSASFILREPALAQGEMPRGAGEIAR
ncbi:MAG: glycoside hydrolase family 3 N-terminal domain-containing protein [Planctomycetota bacterium]